MPPRSRHPATPTGYFRNGLPDLDDMFPVQVGKSGTFNDGNPQDVPPGLMLAVTFNTSATATVQGVYRNGNTGQARSTQPGQAPIYYSGRLYQQVKPSAADSHVSWEIIDPMGLNPFASGSAAPLAFPAFIAPYVWEPLGKEADPTSTAEQTVLTVPASQVWEFGNVNCFNSTGSSQTVTIKVYDTNGTTVLWSGTATVGAGAYTATSTMQQAFAWGFAAGSKVTLTNSGTLGATGQAFAGARRVV